MLKIKLFTVMTFLQRILPVNEGKKLYSNFPNASFFFFFFFLNDKSAVNANRNGYDMRQKKTAPTIADGFIGVYSGVKRTAQHNTFRV